jgi:L,D-transpeptidase YcbB
MKKHLLLLAALIFCTASSPPNENGLEWTPTTLSQLRAWIEAAPQEGLCMQIDPQFLQALRAGDAALISPIATAQALKLARLHLLGCATASQRRGWNIASADAQIDTRAMLKCALSQQNLDAFFGSLRPKTPEYEALRMAYRREMNPARRLTLARNMERWRWMPLHLGQRYLLVNAAAYEVSLKENNRTVERWRVIVGKPKTPAPVFSAYVTGVTINPWWNVPQSIVAESVGTLVRTNPPEARRRGFVWDKRSIRQRPGPTNSLGQMKLAMPNPYNVYLHDTPSKALFRRSTRALSHGCIRVDNALGFAARVAGRSVAAAVASGETRTLPLAEPMHVYITYFTADLSAQGTIALHNDIYGRDGRMGDSRSPSVLCAA